MPSKQATELAEVYLKKVRGNYELTHCQKLDILIRLIDDAVEPLVEILEDAHEALGDYKYNGFNIRCEKIIAEWATGEGK